MNGKGANFMVFFGLFWSAMTLAFDGFIGTAFVRQMIALNYATTDGTILSSKVAYHDDSEGAAYGVAVSYTYSVNGQEYTGERYRYGAGHSSDGDWANQAVARNQPGSKVRVFYNPRHPADAVLVRGIEGFDLFQLAFMTPFNAVMIGFWYFGAMRLWRGWFKPVAGGVKLISQPRKVRARMQTFSPLAVMFCTVALLAFLSIFVVGFLAGGFHPTLHTMEITWSIILVSGFVAGLWHSVQVLSGRYDLVIDELGSTLELPATQGRKARRRVSFADIESISVETILKPAQESNETPSRMYAPTLSLNGSEPKTERLAEWHDADQAAGFVEWLREKLPVKPPSRPLAGKF